MTALAADTNRVRFGRSLNLIEASQKTASTVYQGSGVVESAGYATKATTATGLVTMGVAVNGSVNAGADGAVKFAVECGDFLFVNDAGDPVLAANVGAVCYWTDDNTVSITSTGKSIAGRIIALNPTGYTGVIVRVGVIPGT